MDCDRNTQLKSWPHRLAVTIWTGLLLGSWLLAGRAAAGALTSPLTPTVAWLVTATTAGIGVVAALLHRVVRPSTGTTPLVITLSLAPALITGVILVDVSHVGALLGLLAVLLCTVITVLWSQSASHDSRRVKETKPRATTAAAGLLNLPPTISRTPDELNAAPARLSQKFQRLRDSTGDRLEGQVTIEWPPEQQHQSIHVPFVPAFRNLPEVSCTCDQQDHGSSVRARVASVRRFGVRIELRRSSGSADSMTTRLDIVAGLETPSSQQAA